MRAAVLLLALVLGAGGSAGFVPPTKREGRSVSLSVTFPDGSRRRLTYPPSLRLAELTVRPHGSGRTLLGCRCGRDFAIFHGDAGPLTTGRTLVKSYRGTSGLVGLWRARSLADQPRFRLVFQFGPWFVGVWDDGTMSEDHLAMWARSLIGEEKPDGFLVLRAKPSLRLARAGEHAGPELMFGYSPRRMLLLLRGPCRSGRRVPCGRVSRSGLHRGGFVPPVSGCTSTGRIPSSTRFYEAWTSDRLRASGRTG